MYRETEVYTQDLAQMLMYGKTMEEIPTTKRMVWIDDIKISECEYEYNNYNFKYCTLRFYEGGEHRICSAECLQ